MSVADCIRNARDKFAPVAVSELKAGMRVLIKEDNKIGKIDSIEGDQYVIQFVSPNGAVSKKRFTSDMILPSGFGKFSDDVLDTYEEYLQHAAVLTSDAPDPVKFASDETVKIITQDLEHQKRIRLGSIYAKLQLEEYIRNAKDPFKAMEGIANPRAGVAGNSLYLQEKVILNQVLAPIHEFIEEFKKSELTGLRFKSLAGKTNEKLDLMKDVVRELYNPGETKNAKADQLAKLFTQASENMRLMFNKAGGDISYNPGWRLPQKAHAAKVITMGKDAFKAFVKPLLNRESMLDNTTKLPLTESKLDEVLESVYTSMTREADGELNAFVERGANRNVVLAKKHKEHRVLIFKDGDSWLQYHNRLGDFDVFDLMMNHFRSLAKDTATMQILGPSPDSTIKFLRNVLNDIADEKNAAEGTKKYTATAESTSNFFEDMVDIHRGRVQRSETTFARGMKNYRSLLMATRLGYTPLIALPTDMMTVRKMAKVNGMSQWQAVTGYLKTVMNITNSKERSALAAELGILNEAMMDGTSAALARFLHEDNASPFFQFVVDSSLRLNGLTHITTAGRQYAGMMMMRNFAKAQEKSFAELNPQMQKGLARYEINANDWEIIKRAETHKRKFANKEIGYLRAADISKVQGIDVGAAQEIADKYSRMIFGETEVAVPTVSYRQRAQLQGVSKGGAIGGEILRSFAMFKSWPFAYYHNHIHRSWVEAETKMQKLSALADTIAFMTLGGALGLQLYEIAHGRKPRNPNPLDNPEEAAYFWGASFARGGGLGPAFDVLMGLSDYRQGLSGYIAGPLVGSVDNIGYAITGSFKDTLDGDVQGMGTRIMKQVISHTPYQNNWMISLLLRRLVWEKIMLWNDPEYAKSLDRAVRYHEAEGKEYWWMPGEDSPTSNPFN